MSEKMREEFEAAWAEAKRSDDGFAGGRPLRSEINPDRYRGDAVNFAFMWWKRSRDCMCINMPAEAPIVYDDYDAGYNMAIRDSKDAMLKCGVKCK